MNRIVKFLFIILLISSSTGTSAFAVETSKPDFQDFYRPIIKSISLLLPVEAKVKAGGGYTYPLMAQIDLEVRVHSNSLTGVKLVLRDDKEVPQGTPCQSLNNVKISIGNTENSGNEGNLQTLSGLTSRTSDQGWFLEKYKIMIPIPSNSYLKPCTGQYQLKAIFLRDIAGHFKSILVNYGTDIPFYESLGRFDSDRSLLPLPENGCPKTTISEFRSMPTACIENIKPGSLDRNFGTEEIQIAERLAVKAAADKAAADKAAAKPVVKEKTIICLKGKSSLKVIGKNPKCPAGYKVRK